LLLAVVVEEKALVIHKNLVVEVLVDYAVL
jgi:hypothetical protein